MKIYKGKVGKEAWKVSPVWKLGLHAFKTSDSHILRLCYFRGKSGTHYIQVSKDRELLNVQDEGGKHD